ncbi:hypothetical protein [Acetobacter okinawensis]|uniref:hypothetical protein n=1 Tax=Acetobacter okinawensis TaxID=1076594 RepID=UPI000A56B4BD|nr:hypothetical protein [Acetobacter okinawensis]
MSSSTSCDQPSRSLISASLATPALRADRWLAVLDLARKWSAANGADIKKNLSAALVKLDEIERFLLTPARSFLNGLKAFWARMTIGPSCGWPSVFPPPLSRANTTGMQHHGTWMTMMTNRSTACRRP